MNHFDSNNYADKEVQCPPVTDQKKNIIRTKKKTRNECHHLGIIIRYEELRPTTSQEPNHATNLSDHENN